MQNIVGGIVGVRGSDVKEYVFISFDGEYITHSDKIETLVSTLSKDGIVEVSFNCNNNINIPSAGDFILKRMSSVDIIKFILLWLD